MAKKPLSDLTTEQREAMLKRNRARNVAAHRAFSLLFAQQLADASERERRLAEIKLSTQEIES